MHTFTDSETDTRYTVQNGSSISRDRLSGDREWDQQQTQDALCAEVLRLAQREADLLTERDDLISERDGWKRTAETSQAALHETNAALIAARSALGGRVDQLEEELRQADERDGRHLARIAELEREKAWLAIANEMGRAASDLAAAKRASLESALLNWKEIDVANRKRVQALERENREKCLELAEKAGRIRELEGELDALRATVEEVSGIADRRLTRVAETETARLQLLHENRGLRERLGHLEAAVEDGIAHVERARQSNLHDGEHGRQFRAEQLDLAHEALSGAGVPVVGPAGGASEPPCGGFTGEQWRIIQRIAHELQPAGKPPARARLDSLEESRGHHAVMLTDHADRLKVVEAQLTEHQRRLGTYHNRIAALEAGGDPEGLVEVRARLTRLEIAKETAVFRMEGFNEELAALERKRAEMIEAIAKECKALLETGNQKGKE